jgi:hypothetical protein
MPLIHVSSRPKRGSASLLFRSLTEGSLSDVDTTRAFEAGLRPQVTASFSDKYKLAILNFLADVAIVTGSVCFLNQLPLYVHGVGAWLYIGASLVNAGICWWHIFQLCGGATDGGFTEEESDELFENVHYVISSLIFTGGCICYLPWSSGFFAEWLGAYMFMIGSLGFLSAAFFNALGYAARRAKEKQDLYSPGILRVRDIAHRLSSCELWLSIMGSTFFFMGSFLYRPSYENTCKTSIYTTICVDARQEGTILQLIGSIMFLLVSIITLGRITLFARAQSSSEPKEVVSYGTASA